MKKQLFSFLFILSLFIGIAAQQPKPAASPQVSPKPVTATKPSPTPKPDPAEQRLRKHVAYLASDKLEGRRTGEKGATFAAGYVTNAFAAAKLKPGYRDAKGKVSFLQPFPYVTGVEMGKNNSFTLDITRLDGSRITATNMLPAKPLGASPNGEAKNAEVVFAGYGIVAPDRSFDDYAGLNVQGRVVLVFDGNPESDNPRSSFARFSIHAKAKIAKDKGALGLLVISNEKEFEKEKLAQLKYDPTVGELALPTFVISKNTGFNMLGTNEDGMNTIAGFIGMKKDTPGAKVNLPAFPKSVVGFNVDLVKKQTNAYNVIGVLEGTDPVLKGEAIVIGAHYDHLGRGGRGSLAANSTEVHHGADDNASGTAALIELAGQFAKAKANKRTIIFIAFGGEEEGLLGSKHYVNNPTYSLEKIVAMLNMDMVGRLKDGKLNVGGIGTASEWKGLVERKNLRTIYPGDSNLITTRAFSANTERTVVATDLIVVPQTPYFNLQLNQDGFGPSDHASFYGKKIPVLFFFTGTHTDYHKPSDTAEKINYEGLNNIARFASSLAKAIDENPKRPTYTVAQSSGSDAGRRGFAVSLGTIPGYGDANDGMLIEGVRDGSPAAKIGLKAGDKIVKLAGKEIRNVQDYTFVLGDLKAGIEYEIEIVRAGVKQTLKITPVARN
jgi:hypothetical protein